MASTPRASHCCRRLLAPRTRWPQAAIRRSRRASYSPHESLVTQAVAAGACAMPATAGLLGAIPALELAGQRFDARWLTLWGACLGAIGLAMALPLRRRLVIDEPLPFP